MDTETKPTRGGYRPGSGRKLNPEWGATKRYTFRLPIRLLDGVKEKARSENRPVAAVILDALAKYIKP